MAERKTVGRSLFDHVGDGLAFSSGVAAGPMDGVRLCVDVVGGIYEGDASSFSAAVNVAVAEYGPDVRWDGTAEPEAFALAALTVEQAERLRDVLDTAIARARSAAFAHPEKVLEGP